jgi:hypothetical protein
MKLSTYINTAWPHYKADDDLMKKYLIISKEGIKESKEVLNSLMPDIEAFKRETQ